ncbi:hypothetical protein E6H36_00925 [Candidatus Bathyarchaeota archaeon]|nr:MAG: hypothetical protein E6H36_00925 [Candidatus Bathyarchaeota archaeon]TMI30670.1 MAG: hypothetical protein E6H29_07975 [Candidatus Bathyarchaeota archaeon]
MQTPVLILFLSLTFLMATPSPVITSVRAVAQSGNTTWSPYGPYSRNLLISFYSDFQAMFNAFTSGKIDITDWPVQPGDLQAFSGNPDYFLTSPEGQFGLFHLNINQNGNFLGIVQQQSRSTVAASVKNTASAANTCLTGFARLIVNLHNQELPGKPLILDPLNNVVASSTSGTFSVADSGAATPTGQYIIPSSPNCIPQNPSYTLSSTVYGGATTISVAASGGAPTTFTVDFNVNWNSVTSLTSSPAGVQINRAISHLVDAKSFVNENTLGGQADNPHFWSAPAQGYNNVCDNPIGGSSGITKICQINLNEDCTGSNPSNAVNPHPWVASCAPASPYDLSSQSLSASTKWWGAQGASLGIDKGYPSTLDLRAACDHFVLAGLTVVDFTPTVQDPNGCGQVATALTGTTAPSGQYAHLSNNGAQVVVLPRTDPPRRDFGTIVADGLNALFGTPNNANNPNNPLGQRGCTVNYVGPSSPGVCAWQAYTITQIFDQVFSNNLGAGANDWKIYTGGNTLGTLGDDTYFEFNTVDNGGLCAGVFSTYQLDYTNYCNPVYDTWTRAGEFAPDLNLAGQLFKRGFLQEYRDAFNVPVFSRVQQFVALNSWNFQPGTKSSLVAQLGAGFQISYWSLLNMRCNPSFTPTLVQNACGGGVNGLIRRGFSQDVHKLSPFQAQSVWEFEVLLQVYDTMLAPNPLTGGASNQLVDWMTTSHTSAFSPSETSCIGTNCVAGTTTELWHLRNDLRWHDGVPVTADDVAYTILAYRDVPSANLGTNVAAVSSAIAISSTTIQVKLQHQSPFFETEIGGLPIIPKHLWAPVCGSPPSPASLCGSPSFDPMAAGLYVGSGPWVCKNINTGAIGGSCTQNADNSIGTQDVTLSGRVLLTANMNYMRGPTTLQGSSLQKSSWGDKNDDGVINLLDIADAALHFGRTDPYWDHPLFGTSPGIVDIGEIATIAMYFDHGITKPYAPSALTGLDPRVDPFRADLTSQGGPIMYYQGGLRSGTGQLNVQLDALTGTPSPTAFSAVLNTDSGTLVGTTTGTAGSTASLVTFPFSGISPGTYQLRLIFSGAQPYMTIMLVLT